MYVVILHVMIEMYAIIQLLNYNFELVFEPEQFDIWGIQAHFLDLMLDFLTKQFVGARFVKFTELLSEGVTGSIANLISF